jgi:hypothetical protein
MSDNNCSCWRKVYEHDADGNPLSGTLTDLVDAIKSGGVDVQIGYAFRDGETRGEWRRTCPSVTYAENPRGQVVSCIITDIPDTQLNDPPGTVAGRIITFPPIAYEWQSYNTSGQRYVVKLENQGGAIIGYTPNRLRIAWYVRGVQP